MRFSVKEQVGLRAMVELARSYGQGPIALSDVATAEGLSLSYLEQVISPLRKAGLVDSRRGAYGGYELAREPRHITAGDIIRAVEGAIISVPCMDDHRAQSCKHGGACASHNVWTAVRSKLVETLDGITLADLMDQDAGQAETRPAC